MDAGCDTIFACGGDGTVHNLVQVLANTPVALGVFPIGTANALAHDLRWPFRIPAAAKAALQGEASSRCARSREAARYLKGSPITCHFVVAAGIGVDAHLFYKLQSGIKQRLGMAAYYAKAWHMWFSYAMPRFNVQYQQSSTSAPKLRMSRNCWRCAFEISEACCGNSRRELHSTATMCDWCSATRRAGWLTCRT